MDTSLYSTCLNPKYSPYILNSTIKKLLYNDEKVLLFGYSNFPYSLLSKKSCQIMHEHLMEQLRANSKDINGLKSIPLCGLWICVFLDESDRGWITRTILEHPSRIMDMKEFEPTEKLAYRVSVKLGSMTRKRIRNFLKAMERQSFTVNKWGFDPHSIQQAALCTRFDITLDLESAYKVILRIDRMRYMGKYVHFSKLPED